jgi:hypothetical protein
MKDDQRIDCWCRFELNEIAILLKQIRPDKKFHQQQGS